MSKRPASYFDIVLLIVALVGGLCLVNSMMRINHTTARIRILEKKFGKQSALPSGTARIKRIDTGDPKLYGWVCAFSGPVEVEGEYGNLSFPNKVDSHLSYLIVAKPRIDAKKPSIVLHRSEFFTARNEKISWAVNADFQDRDWLEIDLKASPELNEEILVGVDDEKFNLLSLSIPDHLAAEYRKRMLDPPLPDDNCIHTSYIKLLDP